MSFAIISGRNNGYPCIPELDELISAERKPPYSDFMMIAAGNSYPVIKKLALKKSSADRTIPYPDFIFRCIPNLNGGYPYFPKLGTLAEDVKSSLFAGERSAGLLSESSLNNAARVRRLSSPQGETITVSPFKRKIRLSF